MLTTAEIFWLSTTRADGRPHVTPIPAIWTDGALHICTGAEEQKAVNLHRDPRCILTTGTPTIASGLDIVVEGAVSRVRDQDTLHRLAALWKSRLDWDYRVTDDGFDDGSGKRTGLVFALRPVKVLAFGKGEPYSQTRFSWPA